MRDLCASIDGSLKLLGVKLHRIINGESGVISAKQEVVCDGAWRCEFLKKDLQTLHRNHTLHRN